MLCKLIPITKKTLWLLLLALCTVTTASAQQSNCSAKIDQLPDAPELRGFHLGMTYDQVKDARAANPVWPRGSVWRRENQHQSSFGPQFDKASFADVRTISLDFLDGKLVTLWIGYESTFKWQKLDEFVAGMSKVLNLPAAWPPKRGGQQLNLRWFLSVGVGDRRQSRHSPHG